MQYIQYITIDLLFFSMWNDKMTKPETTNSQKRTTQGFDELRGSATRCFCPATLGIGKPL